VKKKLEFYTDHMYNHPSNVTCDEEMKEVSSNEARKVIITLAISAVVAVILFCVGQTGFRSKLEVGTIASSITTACAIVVFFMYVVIRIRGSTCIQKDMACEDIEDIKTPVFQAINWATSFVALAVALPMIRARDGAWSIIGTNVAITLLGCGLAVAAGSYIEHALRPALCTRPPVVSVPAAPRDQK